MFVFCESSIEFRKNVTLISISCFAEYLQKREINNLENFRENTKI